MIRRTLEFAFLKANHLVGSRVEYRYRRFLEMEYASKFELRNLQEERLDSLLRHSRTQVPFYRDHVSVRSDPQIADFPIVRKVDLRSRYLDFMTPSLRKEYRRQGRWRSRQGWLEVKTGGTTGVPSSVVHDQHFRDEGRASRLFSQRLCGFPFGIPYARLWGSMRDINRMADSWTAWISRVLARERTLNAFRMSAGRMDRYLDIIEQKHYRYLMAYVDAANELALHVERTGRRPPQFTSIMACAGTVTEDVRSRLVRVFGARVHNKYGSRDCADIACECESGSLHVYDHQVFLEILNEDGRPCKVNEPGRLLVTLLGNRSFPLIRYEIGDVAVWRGGECVCGRKSSLLASIEGRTVEFLRNVQGAYVSPVYIRHLIGVVHNPGFIRKFQLVQESQRRFDLRLELEGSEKALIVYPELERKLVKDLEAVLGVGVEIRIHRVEGWHGDPEKHLYTLNRIGSVS